MPAAKPDGNLVRASPQPVFLTQSRLHRRHKTLPPDLIQGSGSLLHKADNGTNGQTTSADRSKGMQQTTAQPKPMPGTEVTQRVSCATPKQTHRQTGNTENATNTHMINLPSQAARRVQPHSHHHHHHHHSRNRQSGKSNKPSHLPPTSVE